KLRQNVVRMARSELTVSVNVPRPLNLRPGKPLLQPQNHKPAVQKSGHTKRRKRPYRRTSFTRRLLSPMSILASERRRGHECLGTTSTGLAQGRPPSIVVKPAVAF